MKTKKNKIKLATEGFTNKMKNSIKLSDFTFQTAGYGHYIVTYTSQLSRKTYRTITSDMQLIDATKNADEPKKVDLNKLKKVCKNA